MFNVPWTMMIIDFYFDSVIFFFVYGCLLLAPRGNTRTHYTTYTTCRVLKYEKWVRFSSSSSMFNATTISCNWASTAVVAVCLFRSVYDTQQASMLSSSSDGVQNSNLFLLRRQAMFPINANYYCTLYYCCTVVLQSDSRALLTRSIRSSLLVWHPMQTQQQRL